MNKVVHIVLIKGIDVETGEEKEYLSGAFTTKKKAFDWLMFNVENGEATRDEIRIETIALN